MLSLYPPAPFEAAAKEAERKEQDRNLAELRQSLDKEYRESIEEATKGPPPATVRAYEAVYGYLPRGWPPVPLQSGQAALKALP